MSLPFPEGVLIAASSYCTYSSRTTSLWSKAASRLNHLQNKQNDLGELEEVLTPELHANVSWHYRKMSYEMDGLAERRLLLYLPLKRENKQLYIYVCVCVLLTVSCPPLFFFVHPPQLPGNESFSESAFCTVKHNGALEWCCDANLIKFSFLCSRKQWRCYEKKIMAGTSIAEGGVFESRILSKSTCTESNQRIVTMVV